MFNDPHGTRFWTQSSNTEATSTDKKIDNNTNERRRENTKSIMYETVIQRHEKKMRNRENNTAGDRSIIHCN